MTKKVLCCFLSALLLLFSLNACTAAGEDKQIVVPIDSQPEYLDAQIVSNVGARNIIANCFEGLVSLASDGSIVPAAAESYTVSDNGLVYTFKLRQDCEWKITRAAGKIVTSQVQKSTTQTQEDVETTAVSVSDCIETAVTANDFSFAIKRALQPETKSPYAWTLMNIKNAEKVNSGKMSSSKLGVRAKDRYTLVIELERKDANFLYALTTSACMPCNEEYFEYTRGHYGLSNEYLIYNGPFYISSWTDSAITVRRNDKYHMSDNKSTVKPASVYFSFNNEQETRSTKIKNTTYHLAKLTEKQAQEFEESKSVSINTFSSAVSAFVFNCANETLSNVNIRKAIAYATDIKPLCEYYNKEAAKGIVPLYCVVAGENYRSKAADNSAYSQKVKQAMKYFKQGLDELEKDEIEISVLCSVENETVVRSVMQQWQSVFGVAFTVSVEAVQPQELASRVSQKNYAVAFTELTASDYFAQSSVMAFQSQSRDNIASLSDAKYDALVKKISKCGTVSTMVSAVEKAEQYLVENAVVIPVCQLDCYYALGKGVSAIAFSPTGEVAYYKSALRK